MRFVLMLHSHLPWVLHHGRWPHGSDWLCEAAVDSYLPLVAMLDQLEREQIAPAITIGITPILAAQLAHPSFRTELDHYFAHRLETLDEAPASLHHTGDGDLLPLVSYWKGHLEDLRSRWERLDKDLIAAFRRHAAAGHVELISSAATHGFLPLLGRDESIRLQLLVGRNEHANQFGTLPSGCWAPECAYRPSGPWHPAVSAPGTGPRVGIEAHLRYAGFQYFFVDAHLVDAGEAWDLYSGRTRMQTTPGPRSPFRAYRVSAGHRARPVSVLVRDPVSTSQVWSRYGGYPGDGRYLEFHKMRSPGGLKFWRVTGADVDLGAKDRYLPDLAQQAAVQHAGHFRGLLTNTAQSANASDHAIVAPFDTELFGHWWYEGMDFLGDLYRDLSRSDAIVPCTATQAMTENPAALSLRMAEGSWGKDGDFSMWLNAETSWTWDRLWPLEQRFWDAVPAAMLRHESYPILEQAARELLLAQASDWQFIISTGAAGDYATVRFVEHCDALASLLPYLEHEHVTLDAGLARAHELSLLDGPFTDLIGPIAAASDVPAT